MQVIDNQYYVHKFGGSSLCSAERIIFLKSLLSGKDEIIVVSAINDTTSTLQAILDNAKSNLPYLHLLDNLKTQHCQIIEALSLGHKKDALMTSIQKDFFEIENILDSIKLTKAYSTESQNNVLGYGEQWSAKIVADYLSKDHQVLYIDASTILFVFEKNGIICVDWEKTQKSFNAFLKNKTFDQAVITGFIASTLDGTRTTLGRNGSDFSASIFAKLFKAKGLTIWTDVDGILTADPHKVRSAFSIESLSYLEALELAYFGAKVLHPMAISPVLEAKIPLLIKNSFNPKAKGTLISDSSGKTPHLIKGLTSIDKIALINIEGTGMIGVSGIAAHIFSILHQKNISIILITQASSEHSICFAISEIHADLAIRALKENLKFEIDNQLIQNIYVDRSCSILSVVGDRMIGTRGVAHQLFYSLAKADINIRAISQGSSERNISLVINTKDINKTLQTVHAGFYLSPKTISIGIIGPGQVGSALLEQIKQNLKEIADNSQTHLLVRGIMNNSEMLLSHEAIDLSKWKEQFYNCDHTANLQEFVNHICSDDMPHAVIIDCTSSLDIAKKYISFIEKNIHIITPNKHANAGDLDYYKKLKFLTHEKNTHYLYEATVCAGLPIITTLQDLIKTGDQVEKIEGIVSGTLSYIFNELAKNRKFSEIVLEAKEKGYTEPDPREDLSGMDVARKLVCLARELGFNSNLCDVQVYNLIPDQLKTGTVSDFLNNLSTYDNIMDEFIAKARMKNEIVRYVGTIHKNGKIEVSIQSFAQDHSFSRLKGTDNILVFHTKRYHSQPLIIQGPGAGAEVTATGIFADLLRLVSFLK